MKFFRGLTRAETIQLSISYLLQATLVTALLVAFIRTEWIVLFITSLALVATFLPSLLGRNYKLYLPIEFQIIIIGFVYAAIFLGSVAGFYTKFWWWDTILHAASGVSLGFIGFLILYTLYLNDRLTASPFLLVTFSFTFGLAFGAIWEIFEFSIDQIFGSNMQKHGLRDTMWDLIMDAAGALLTSILGYLYILHYKRGLGLFSLLINKFLEKNPQLLK